MANVVRVLFFDIDSENYFPTMSSIWNHFEKELEQKYSSKRKSCKRTLKCRQVSISGLIKHLRKKHSAEYVKFNESKKQSEGKRKAEESGRDRPMKQLKLDISSSMTET